jgi:hypothetical protein
MSLPGNIAVDGPKTVPFLETNPHPALTVNQPPVSNPSDRAILEAFFSMSDLTIYGNDIRTPAVLRLNAFSYNRVEIALQAQLLHMLCRRHQRSLTYSEIRTTNIIFDKLPSDI